MWFADLEDHTVACFLQGDSIDACKHLAPGVVIAALGAAWGNKGQLKVSRSKQVLRSKTLKTIASGVTSTRTEMCLPVCSCCRVYCWSEYVPLILHMHCR